MNLLCPNCQKMLTVPEEFAGQLMKCPLCSGTFTVPGLPGTAAPSAPTPAEPEAETYAFHDDPAPQPSPFTTPFPAETEPPPSPATAPPQPTPQPSLAAGEYQRGMALSLSPKVLPWIAPACLVLVFFLQIIPNWVGLYPGGVEAVWGNAWRAAFGSYAVDGDLKERVPPFKEDKAKPGASVLTIFYLILFFPVLLITLASVALPLLQIKLPAQVERFLPWRWALVAIGNLILFLLLGLQVLLGFSLDSYYTDWVDKEMKSYAKDNPTTPERKEAEARRGELMEMLRHTAWLRFVVFLHLVALVSAVLMVWIERRGTQRPLPKLELRW